MVHAALLVAAMLGVGTGALALAPPLPDCFGPTLDPQEAALGDYDPSPYPNGIVFYNRFNAQQGYEIVVEHCPSRDRMIARFAFGADGVSPDFDAVDRFYLRLSAAFEHRRTYSFSDLVLMGELEGADAAISRADFESCGCRVIAQRGQ